MDSQLPNSDQHALQPIYMELASGMYSETESLTRDFEVLHLGDSSTVRSLGNLSESTPSCCKNGILSEELRDLGFVDSDSPILDNIREENFIMDSFGHSNGDHLYPINPRSYRDLRIGNLGYLERPYAFYGNHVGKTYPSVDYNVSEIVGSNYGYFQTSLLDNGASTSQNNQTCLHYCSIEQNISLGESSRVVRCKDWEGDFIREYPSLLTRNYNSVDWGQEIPSLGSFLRNTTNFNGEGSSTDRVFVDSSQYSRSLPHDGEITQNISSGIFELMIHPNGSHLVSHLFEHQAYEDNWFLLEAALRFCGTLARDEKGSASLKCCIKNSRSLHREIILNKIIKRSANLATDRHGNFVIQFVLDLHEPDVTESICFCLEDHLEDLSKHKFGSYVIQKCLKSSAGELLLLKLVRFDKNKLAGIASDRYGNYVLQTALKVKKARKLHEQLVHAIRLLPMALSCDIYASNVLKLI